MRTVWKSTLKMDTAQIIEMPPGSIIRSVQMQNGQLCLWYEFDWDDRNLDPEKRLIQVVGTGHVEIPDQHAEFLGTVQTYQGAFVWHIYDVTKCHGTDQG